MTKPHSANRATSTQTHGKGLYRSSVTGRLVSRKITAAQAKEIDTEIQRLRRKNKQLGV